MIVLPSMFLICLMTVKFSFCFIFISSFIVSIFNILPYYNIVKHFFRIYKKKIKKHLLFDLSQNETDCNKIGLTIGGKCVILEIIKPSVIVSPRQFVGGFLCKSRAELIVLLLLSYRTIDFYWVLASIAHKRYARTQPTTNNSI